MPTMWVVLLEVDGSAGDRMDAAVARGILEAIADNDRAGLYSSDRVALQAWVVAVTPSQALETATARWIEAARRSGVRGWQIVRAEVLSPDEFERDCEEPDFPVELSTLPVGSDELTPPDAHEEELLRRALHDSLTHLADRELFRMEVEHALIPGRTSESVAAVLYLDLDEFRWVNRMFGARVGDQVLVEVARRIATGIRPGDVAARTGGDRFAILLENTTRASAALVAERILEAIRAPHDVGGRTIVSTASVGVAFSPPAADADGLIANAEAAMRSAKELHTGGIAFFDPDDDPPGEARVLDRGRRPEMIAYVALLERAATVANECETLEEAAAILLAEICTHTGWSVGRLYLPDAETPHVTTSLLSTLAEEGHHAISRRTAPFQATGDGSPRAKAVATRQPAWTGEAAQAGNCARADDPAGVAMTFSLAVPVLAGEEVVAVLEFMGEGELEPDPSLVQVVASAGVQLGRVVERSRALTSAAAAEARLHALLEASADFIAVMGSDGTVVSYYERPEALGSSSGHPTEHVLDRIHPDDLPVAAAYVKAASAAPAMRLSFRCRVRHANGSWIPMRLVANGLLDDPAVRGIVLTANRAAESGARFRDGRLAALGTWRLDVAKGLSEWSQELYAILGLSPEEAVADLEVFLAAVHPDDRSAVSNAVERSTQVEGPVSVEFRVVRPDGTVRWLHGTGAEIRDATGQAVVRHGIVLDITERKEDEELLSTVKRRWTDLLAGSAEMLTFVGRDGAVLFSLAPERGPFSPAAPWRDDVMVTELVHPDDFGLLFTLLSDVVSRPGVAGPVELRVRCADGSWRRVASLAENLLDDPVVGAIVLRSWDVTEVVEGHARQDAFADEIDGPPAEAVVPGSPMSPRPTFASR